jgi:hypothetical protein
MPKKKQTPARPKKPRKSARSTKATPIKKQPREREKTQFLKASFLSLYPKLKCNVTNTAARIHIDRGTFYDWLVSDPAFKAAADAALESLIDHVEDQLHHLIDRSEPSAVYFFLKCKAKHRGYIEKTEIGGNVNLTHQMSMEDLNKSREAYRKAGKE